MNEPNYTDIRLIPFTAEHHAALTSENPEDILRAVVFLVNSYEKAPPLTFSQAVAYARDVDWWREQISDL